MSNELSSPIVVERTPPPSAGRDTVHPATEPSEGEDSRAHGHLQQGHDASIEPASTTNSTHPTRADVTHEDCPLAPSTALTRRHNDELETHTIERARLGDSRSARALVERYQRPVFSLLRRMLHGRALTAEIDELAQETFLRVFRALPNFDPAGRARLSTWILTIASRLAIDRLRRRLPETRPTVQELAEHSATTSADRLHLAHLVRMAVEALTPEYRAAFLLRYYHELEYEEIAEALDIELGTVKSRLSRARAALRVSLEDVHRG